jgi:hypothetical protein
MAHPVTWIDRVRIERAVWMLDQRLYDLPRRSRIAKRREVRQNLLCAAQDVGTGAALRGLGTSSELAAEYLDAELGTGPRHSWMAAALFLVTGQLVLTSILTSAAAAFADGVTAGDPSASGTYTWSGIDHLQDRVTYTFVDGHGTWVGGAWTPLAWGLWLLATVLVGRLWRALPWWRRSRGPLAAAP